MEMVCIPIGCGFKEGMGGGVGNYGRPGYRRDVRDVCTNARGRKGLYVWKEGICMYQWKKGTMSTYFSYM